MRKQNLRFVFYLFIRTSYVDVLLRYPANSIVDINAVTSKLVNIFNFKIGLFMLWQRVLLIRDLSYRRNSEEVSLKTHCRANKSSDLQQFQISLFRQISCLQNRLQGKEKGTGLANRQPGVISMFGEFSVAGKRPKPTRIKPRSISNFQTLNLSRVTNITKLCSLPAQQKLILKNDSKF